MSDSFSQLSLAPALARAVAEMGYESMTPIQAQAIPVVLQGRDVMGAAQTGTGKTAAFSLPLLQRMMKHENASTSPARHPVRALVLLPTRELADQVAQQVALYAKYTQLRSAVVFGGMDMKPQTAELKKGVEVLVATPGRLLDHIEAKNCVLNQVEYVVLDEADRMLDIGFLPDLQRILSYLPKQRTTLLFSATFSPEIKRLASSYLQDPVTIEVARSNATASTVEQRFIGVPDEDKRRAIHHVLRERGIKQAFIFVNSKLGCARLARSLEREGLKTTALHGDKSQDERLKALDAFKSGAVDLLVCTDVAARGLDIKDVPAVFNFDLPFNAEDYVHRIGRTGRAGASGLAVSLVSPSDSRLLGDIEKLINIKANVEPLPLEDAGTPPVKRYNDGLHHWGKDDDNEARRRAPRPARSGAPDDAPGAYRGGRDAEGSRSAPARSRYAPRQPVDPFFEKPYEPSPSANAKAAGWEPETRANLRSLSANIKPKKRVAALFRTPMPALPVAAEAGMPAADTPQSLPQVGNADQPLAPQQAPTAVALDNA